MFIACVEEGYCFCILISYPVPTTLNSFIVSINLSLILWGSRVYYCIICKYRRILSSLTILMPLSSLVLTVLANISRTLLHSSRDSDHPCLVRILVKMPLLIFPLHTTTMLALKLRHRHFTMLSKSPQLLFLWVFVCFIMIGYLILLKVIIIFLKSIYIVYNINGVVNIEPTLPSWNKFHLAMVHCFLNVLLDFVFYLIFTL